MIYHPKQYDFDTSDRTEWYPNGVFNYNVSRMIRDLDEYLDKRLADEDKDRGIQLKEISIRENYYNGINGILMEWVRQ